MSRTAHQGLNREVSKLIYVTFRVACLIGILGGLASCEEDVSKQPCFETFIGSRWELICPVFFIKSEGKRALIAPGDSPNFPVSADDFLNHPNNWWESAAYLQQYGIHSEPDSEPILAIIDAGTVIQIKRIVCSTGVVFDYFLIPEAEIQNGRLKGCKASISDIVNNLTGNEAYPEPESDWLRQVDITPGAQPLPTSKRFRVRSYAERCRYRSTGPGESLEVVDRAKQKAAAANEAQQSRTSE